MSLGVRRIAVVTMIAVALAAPARAQPGGDAGLAKGIQQVQDGDSDGAVATLDGVVRRLSAAADRKDDLAQAYLWLGIAYAQLDSEKSGRASFREALKLDPRVNLAEGWPPKVARLFAAVREEMVPAGAASDAPSWLVTAAELETAGRMAEAEAIYRQAAQRTPGDGFVCQSLAFFLHRSPARFDEAVSTLERCNPGDADGYYRLATLYWDKAYRGQGLDDRQKEKYADLGLVNVNKALKVQPDFLEAVVYKGLLLRTKALVTKDPGKQAEYIKDANRLQMQALDIRERRQPGSTAAARRAMSRSDAETVRLLLERDRAAEDGVDVEGGVPGGVGGGTVGALPPPPPPPSAPVRVGGQIKPPTQLKYVRPVYPPIAQQARVQGVVILECTISPQGKVTEVKVLRSIPLLDAAAVEAVKQYEYTPTLLNGVPVPVIMTVTANFTLQ